MSPVRPGNATQFKEKSTVAEPTSAIRSGIDMKNNLHPEIQRSLEAPEVSFAAKEAIRKEFTKLPGKKSRAVYPALVIGCFFLFLSIAGRIVIEEPTDKTEGASLLFFWLGFACLSSAQANSHRINIRKAIVELLELQSESSNSHVPEKGGES